MKKIYFTLIILGLYSSFNYVQAQSLSVGNTVLEDYYRRKQLLGELDSSVSFTIRPLSPSALKVDNIFDPEGTLADDGLLSFSGPLSFANGHGTFQLLPLSIQQQYNSHHPYGGNDGAMIPARGYQTLVGGGFFVKLGPLSIQLRPEFVYAQNKNFDGYALGRSDFELAQYYRIYNQLDAPEQFGQGAYTKANWGQSSIRLTVGPVSVGLSNENLWWGPGRSNSLLMGNNASGFKHLTLNTVRPVKTPIGSFEAQIIAGKLENSGLTPLSTTTNSAGVNLFKGYRDDWRYLTGFNINYQPKWIPGLFVGFIRDFMSYHEDLNGFGDYFPFFTPVEKIKSGLEGDPFSRDQRLSFYSRWVFQKAHAEVYFEYGLNDNSYNLRDFAGSPQHSRAYIFGLSKMIPVKNRNGDFIQVNAEINQMSSSIDREIRPDGGGFYLHGQVAQGYTNEGQVLGSGMGSGGNLQTLSVNWVRGLKKLGLAFDRYEHNADFYNYYLADFNGNSRRWVDFALGAQGEWDYKNLLFSAKLQGIKSLNYQWRMKDYTANEYYVPHNDVFNVHAELGVSFRF